MEEFGGCTVEQWIVRNEINNTNSQTKTNEKVGQKKKVE